VKGSRYIFHGFTENEVVIQMLFGAVCYQLFADKVCVVTERYSCHIFMLHYVLSRAISVIWLYVDHPSPLGSGLWGWDSWYGRRRRTVYRRRMGEEGERKGLQVSEGLEYQYLVSLTW